MDSKEQARLLPISTTTNSDSTHSLPNSWSRLKSGRKILLVPVGIYLLYFCFTVIFGVPTTRTPRNPFLRTLPTINGTYHTRSFVFGSDVNNNHYDHKIEIN